MSWQHLKTARCSVRQDYIFSQFEHCRAQDGDAHPILDRPFLWTLTHSPHTHSPPLTIDYFQDFEPEYASFLPGGSTAVISLQENNAIALLDVPTATIAAILPLGFKDHSLAINALDPSDRDSSTELRTFEKLRGMYMPDETAAFEHEGQHYVVS